MEFKTINKEILVDLQEKYIKIRKLLDEHSKLDSATEPYKSKYAARDILKEMQIKLVDVLAMNLTEEEKITVTAMLAVVWLNLGIISVDTEELTAGEEQLLKCTDTLEKIELRPESILPMISALNQLGIVWSQRDQPLKSKQFLKRAEKIYKDYMSAEDHNHIPIGMAALFGMKDEDEPNSKDILEKLHTLTLYYLAQICGALKDHFNSAVYCHMTLHRQLSHKDFDSIDWALNAATLSQFFMEKGGYHQAKHHLAAASYILQKYKIELRTMEQNSTNEEAMAAKWENFKHRSADVARCWAKYGILLLCASRERLMLHADSEDSKLCSEMSTMKLDSKSGITKECLESLRFVSLEKEIEFIENQVTDRYLLDFNDAKLVFLNVQKWLEVAKNYYTLENHASDYVQLIQDVSQAFRYLAFFEEDEHRRAKMHKRRIDLLEKVVKELNPRYYQVACRQIWVELGEIYSDILDIKLDYLQSSNERPTPRALTKINNLTKSAIENFEKFLDSLKDSAASGTQQTFSEEMVQPALYTYFHLGRLYNKIITPDKRVQLENVKNSMNAYKFLVDYCEKDPKTGELMKTELDVCKDLVSLLPLKIQKLTQEIST